MVTDTKSFINMCFCQISEAQLPCQVSCTITFHLICVWLWYLFRSFDKNGRLAVCQQCNISERCGQSCRDVQAGNTQWWTPGVALLSSTDLTFPPHRTPCLACAFDPSLLFRVLLYYTVAYLSRVHSVLIILPQGWYSLGMLVQEGETLPVSLLVELNLLRPYLTDKQDLLTTLYRR